MPPIATLSLSGLGFVVPYALLATIVSALNPKKIFEVGTFRGATALTMALNAPYADIYTLDLPLEAAPDEAAAISHLSRGDQEWIRLSRTSLGYAFLDHPVAERIHQLYGNSLSFQPLPELQTQISASSTAPLLRVHPGRHRNGPQDSCAQRRHRLGRLHLFVNGVSEYLNELRAHCSVSYRRKPVRSLSS